MSILQAFKTGIQRATKEPKMVLVLYVINLLAAIPLAMAWRAFLQSGLGGSLASSELMDGLDFTVWQDFTHSHGQELLAVTRQIPWVILIFMIVNTFLAGGILGTIRESREKFSASAFFAGCGDYFLRFFRLFLILGVLLVVVAFVVGVVVGGLREALTENATSEVTEFWVRVVALIVFVLPLILIMMIADYAKISVVLNDERKMFKSTWKATRFVFRRFSKTFSLELLLVLVPGVLFAIYLWLDLSIGMTTSLTIIVMFILQQLFVASRAWTKVFFYAAEMTLYQGLRPVGVPATESAAQQSGAGAASV